MTSETRRLVVVGAGPAGLTAALTAAEAGWLVTVLEADPEYVGGIARTVVADGNRFDIGGHRFFSKSPEITQWWEARLPDDFISVRRLSRIYYNDTFFSYPLQPMNALRGLGIINSTLCLLSYAQARAFPRKPERSFADWVTNQFGAKLYRTFFKTYTEKVWGIPCEEISADWAAQRIKGLSLISAVRNAFRGSPKQKDGDTIKTLIDRFQYPRLGPGMMWEKAARDLEALGGRLQMGETVVAIHHEDGAVQSVVTNDVDGHEAHYEADAFIVSMPLRDTVRALSPAPEPAVRKAAEGLRYRDFLTVALVVDGTDLFPDNWIYIHDPKVRVGRIQNYRNWSPEMIKDPTTSCLGLEYFCFEGDDLWNRSDDDLIRLARDELATIGLIGDQQVREGYVVRMEKAYPVYDEHYQQHLDIIREGLTPLRNMQVVGRNGMHKYNNQDHSMMTALLAARNLDQPQWDLWRVNTDAEYHEEVDEERDAKAGRQVPRRAKAE